MGYIYMYESPKGKKYIGQTRTTIACRRKDSFGTGYCECTAFWHAICKYGGISNFKLTILADVDNSLLDDLEQYYIQLYDTLVPNGYNLQLGGADKHSQSTMRAVCQYAENGDFIQLYASITEAAIATHCMPSGIVSVCQGKMNSCGGYRWSYENEQPSKKPFKKKRVYCFNENGILLNEFEKTAAAAHYYHVPQAWITACCNKQNRRKRVLDVLIFTYDPYIDWSVYKLIRNKKSQRSTTILNEVESSDSKCYTSINDEDIV